MGEKRSAATLDLLDVEEFVNIRNLNEVSSSLVLQGSKEINEDGLFSTTIFGDIGSDARLNQYGYIELNTKVMQPFAYGLLAKMNSEFLEIMHGEKYFNVDSGKKLEEVTEATGTTGIELLQNKWQEVLTYLGGEGELSKSREKTIRTLKLINPRKELFTSKWIVVPAGLREINTMDLTEKGIVSYDEMNDFYLDILRLSSSLKGITDYGLTVKLHNKILELHNYITASLSGKQGLIKSKSLKKPVSYSIRSVLVQQNASSTNTWNEKTSNNIKLGEVGISIKLLTSAFHPFCVNMFNNHYKDSGNKELDDFIESHVEKFEDMNKLEVVKKFIDNYCANDYILKQDMVNIKSGGKDVMVSAADWIRHYILYPIVGREEVVRYVSLCRYPYSNQHSNQFLKAIPFTTSNIKEIIDDETGEMFEYTKDIKSMGDGFVLSMLSFSALGADKLKLSPNYVNDWMNNVNCWNPLRAI